MTKVKLLISNDDGITAPGLQSLLTALSNQDKYDIRVGAPDSERSGCSHAFSAKFTSRYSKNGTYFDLPMNVPAYSVTGYPADAVSLTFLHDIFGDNWTPDIVVSGINKGGNGGIMTYMSGTVAAAREGVMNGVKGISISLDDHFANSVEDYKLAVEYSVPVVNWLANEQNWPKLTSLNVNVPLISRKNIKSGKIIRQEEIKGIMITTPSQGYHQYSYKIIKHQKLKNPDVDIKELEPRFTMMHHDETKELHEDDVMAVKAGYVTLTPLPLHSHEHLASAIACLKHWSSQFKHPILPWFPSKL